MIAHAWRPVYNNVREMGGFLLGSEETTVEGLHHNHAACQVHIVLRLIHLG